MKSIVFIVNPISGRSSKPSIIRAIASYIDTSKYDVTIRFTSYAGHATNITDKAVKEGVDIVVAVGGDGTVNEVAKALVKTNTALAIIPCGSGNGLARHLHIPMNVRRAVEVINKGALCTIDAMIVNGTQCFCTAGVGYDAQVSKEYAKEKRRGLVTYIKKAIASWFKYQSQEYIIKTDTQILIRQAIAITCANANQWGNEFHVAPKASITDGLVDVTIIHPIRFWNAFLMPFQILGYSFDRNPDVETIRTSQLVIHSEKYAPFHIDGDFVAVAKDIMVSSSPGSLSVICNHYSSV